MHGIGTTRKKGGMKVQQSKKTGQQMARKPQGCHRCSGNHDAQECRFKKAKCFACQKVGHVKSMCRNARDSVCGGRRFRGEGWDLLPTE